MSYTKVDSMTLSEIVDRACQEPTLVDAMTFAAICETERVVVQARNNPKWETCFRSIFNAVLERWNSVHQNS